MPLFSMTGFARATGANAKLAWAWEVKSVNGKALDVRFRLAPGFEALENPARLLLQQNFKRGSLQVNLTVQDFEQGERLRINTEVLNQYVAVAEDLRQRLGGPPASAEGLMGLRGVVEMQGFTRSAEAQAAAEAEILQTLATAVAALAQSRRAEGEGLAKLLASHLTQIAALHQAALHHPARQPEAIKQRLKDQMAQLLDVHNFDEARLHQEAILLATRADVREELDRLALHIKAAETLLKSAEPVGRKFDFLAQEFNREANTFCSKANDPGLTAIGLDLKTTIDQMREQVQNIE